jgi:hypothetical protein
VGAGWPAPVLAGQELQCISSACARCTVSHWFLEKTVTLIESLIREFVRAGSLCAIREVVVKFGL